MLNERESKNLQRVGQAAFRAGWTAACLTFAKVADGQGERDAAAMFRAYAQRPPPVEVGDLSTPEGKAMAKQDREVVMVEMFPRDGEEER